MKALSIGRLVYDKTVFLDSYPVEGSSNISKEMLTCSGGSANTVAYAMAKWNMEAYISGVIGYDDVGTSMKKDLEENKVRTNYLETNYDIKTLISYIIVNKQNNVGTIINAELNNFNIKKYEYDTDIDCVITDGYEYNASVYAFNKYKDAVTVLNANKPRSELLDFFKYAKYVVCTGDVAEAMTGMKLDFNNPMSMANIYKAIINKYTHINLIIRMDGMGTIYSLNNEIKVIAAVNDEILDKMGAEDIYVAMIGYGLTNKFDIETTIRLASIAECISKKVRGSSLSVPIFSDIVKVYESKFGKLVNPLEEKVDTSNVPAT